MEDMDDEQDYSDDELNPNPADTMILALGLASAMVETFNPVLKSKPKSSGRSVSKDPVKVDINFEEYDVLASILKRTKAVTKEFNEKNLDPIQDLLKLKQPKSAKTPVYSLLKKSGKNTIGVSLVRNCVSDLLEKNKSKYDWWTSMTDFSTPPSNPGRVLSSLQSSYSKYDVWKDIIAKLKQTGEIESTSSTKSNTVNGKQSNEDVTPESSMKEFTISEEETIQERASEAEIDGAIPVDSNLHISSPISPLSFVSHSVYTMKTFSIVFTLFALFTIATTQTTSESGAFHDSFISEHHNARRLSQTEEQRVRSFEELESALEQLPDGGRILIDTSTLQFSNTLQITQSNLHIRGVQNPTTLRCSEDGGFFELLNNGTRLENLHLVGCREAPAITVESRRPGGELEFIGVTFEDNILSGLFQNGAGVFVSPCRGDQCEDLQVVIENCQFLNNSAEIGGAVYADSVSLEFRNCRFFGNEALLRGGGIAIVGQVSNLSLENCEFQSNRVVQPLPGSSSFFGDQNGSPLERTPYWTFQFPNSPGGAVFIDTISQTQISNCSFQSNLAQAGGALGISIDIYAPNRDSTGSYLVEIEDSLFHANQAGYTEEYERRYTSGAVSTDLNHGGGIYLASSTPSLEFRITESVLSSNQAHFGGALHMVTHPQTQPIITNTTFINNRAMEAGGAMLVRNTGAMTITATNLIANSALLGGGLMLTNNARLLVLGPAGIGEVRQGTPTVFEQNSAASGGGIMCSGCGEGVLQDPMFLDNRAEANGGGVFVLDSNSEFRINQGRFENNQANQGGAIAAEVAANIRVATVSEQFQVYFINNTAFSGGGAVFTKANHQRENRVSIMQALFQSNTALGTGDSNECSVGGGGALCLMLDAIPASAVADYLIEDTIMEDNEALVGGGAFIQVDDISWMDGSEALSRCPEARPTNQPCRSFRFANVTITGNEAEYGAGGVFINDPEALALFCPLAVPFERQSLFQVINKAQEAGDSSLDFEQDLFCTRIENNSVQQSEFGHNVGTSVYSLRVVDPVDAVINNHTGGDRLLPPCSHQDDSCDSNRTLGIQVSVLDAFDQRISGGILDSELTVILMSGSIIGEQRYDALEGMININNTIGVGIDTDSRIQIQSIQNRSLSVELNFSARACLPGENASVFSCQACLPNQYSFKSQVGCRDCEDQAICPGRAALVPVRGYWHSTPFSPQFHECIVREACEYDNRLQNLIHYYSNLEFVAQELAELDAYIAGVGPRPEYENYRQCAEGYMGVLCGSCENGYGHFPGGECVECPADRTGSSLIAVLVSVWTALFLGVNIFTTFSSTQRQILMVMCQQGDNSSNRGVELRALSRRGEPSTTSERMHEDRIIAMIKVTELLKIFINYLQITSVALSINLDWQEVIKALLSIEALVMGVASGSYLVPLDCSFDDSSRENNSGVPNSIKVLWLQVTFPLILLVFFTILWGTYLWVRRNRYFVNRTVNFKPYFIVIAIVVTFFSYVKVTSELMRTVNCIGVDNEDEQHEYQSYAIQTKTKVWAEDTRLVCFEGDHTLTGIFGIIGLVCFSLAVILFILTWLPANYGRLKDPEFIAQYGFIYQGYKEEWYLTSWEAIIAIRKALIAAAVVFAFPLGPNLQAVCALGVIILAITVHFIFRPFKRFPGHPNVPPYAGHWFQRLGFESLANWWVLLNNSISLNAMESASLLMSMTVFYSGILFFDENASEGGKHTMAAFTLFVNVSFVIYMLCRLYNGAHVAVNLSCDQLRAITASVLIPDGNGALAFIKKSYLIIMHRNVLDDHIRATATKSMIIEEHI
eukprot:g3031.t1